MLPKEYLVHCNSKNNKRKNRETYLDQLSNQVLIVHNIFSQISIVLF